MSDIILKASNVSRTFGAKSLETKVLSDVSFEIKQSERVAIVGASGSGKSTLLHLLGGLDIPDSGEIAIKGKQLSKMNDKTLSQFRNIHLGFIYQFHHLLPEFTALENVLMPLWISGKYDKSAEISATQVLTKVGLSQRLAHRPAELSGGERQRVAIARAMVHEPDVILADEPTGNLDKNSAETVFDLMNDLNVTSKTTLIMVTHDLSFAEKMDRILMLNNHLITDKP